MLYVNDISIKLEKKMEKKKYLVLICQRLSGWAQEYVFFKINLVDNYGEYISTKTFIKIVKSMMEEQNFSLKSLSFYLKQTALLRTCQ